MYAESNMTFSYGHVIKRFGPYNSRCMSRAQLEAVFELLLKDSAPGAHANLIDLDSPPPPLPMPGKNINGLMATLNLD